MVAYEYYLRNEMNRFELIGVLPERRKDVDRVTLKSIICLGRKFWGDEVDIDNIFFIRIYIDEITGEIFRPKPPLGFDFEETKSGIRAVTTFLYS